MAANQVTRQPCGAGEPWGSSEDVHLGQHVYSGRLPLFECEDNVKKKLMVWSYHLKSYLRMYEYLLL